MASNTCSPARIYGPLPQTVFCGCSVLSFSASAGWNEQASNLTVELVQDTCYGPRVWWDENLNRHQDSMADPGFTEPEPGCAVYFRIEENPDGSTEAERGGFEYAGLVESWNERFDANGNPVYTVKITDPRIILENSQAIVSDYPGYTGNVWNLINIYGYVESLGFACTSSEAGAIGGTTLLNSIGNIANDRGMVWNDVKCALHTLLSSQNRFAARLAYGDYCADARLVYVGPQTGSEGYGIIGRDDIITDSIYQTIPNANLNLNYYTLDLTEIPFSPSYYRISGPNISVMEIISQVCADAGCDYYIDLVPLNVGGQVIKVIKVRVAARNDQPQLGRLDEFIAAKQEEDEGQVLSYSKGEEVRNEPTTTYLIGGNKKESFESTAAQMVPYWGLDTDGNLIQATITSNEYYVRLDFARLNPSLYNAPSQYVWVSESEMRAALGDIDTWKSVTVLKGGDLASWCDTNKIAPVVDANKAIDALQGKKPAHRVTRTQPESISDDIDFQSQIAKDVEKIYEFIRSYANEFYGKKFLVNCTSFVCYALDTENGEYRYSHTPSQDGCWVLDDTTSVVGLTHQTAASDFFRDDQGKYQAIVRFPLTAGFTMGGGGGSITVDTSKMGDDEYITNGSTYVWTKAAVDPEWVRGVPSSPSADIISCIVSISNPALNITSSVNGTDHNFILPINGLGNALDAVGAGAVGNADITDKGSFVSSSLPVAVSPDACLVPVTNHVDTYGPWGVAGLPGQVNLEMDEGFVPWEYGSDQIMANAAADKVANIVAQMRKGERGSIRVAGFPNIPLGAELFSVDTTNPPDSQGIQKYYGSRLPSFASCSLSFSYIYCLMNAWTGEFGPNITNINVSVGAQGFTTEYQFSTYTPQFGRFNKGNAERLRRLGQNRLQLTRNFRSKTSIFDNIKAGIAKSKDFLENQVARSSRAPKSAHHFLIGRYTTSGNPEVNTQPAKDASFAFSSDSTYSGSAVMSWDSLFRPVSKDGDGGLSKFIAPGTVSTTFDSSAIVQAYFDPYSNPNSTAANLSDTPTTGHDIEVLGRNYAQPKSGWAIEDGEEAGSGGYTDDYRFMALKGPIVLQQWGFDTDGKPVPNKVDDDTDAQNGIFSTTSLEDKFLDGFLKKPKTWPVAPLDIRLDRDRGVWTAVGGGGNSCDKIRFTILGTGAAGGVWIARIDARPCECSTVPLESGGQVNVVDALGCTLSDVENPTGLRGYADYMNPSSTCQWEVSALCCANNEGANYDLSFFSSWNTKSDSGIDLPLKSGNNYQFIASWGDGSYDIITGWDQTEASHTYSSTGTYNINLVGSVSGFEFNTGNRDLINNISSWNAFTIDTTGIFSGTTNLTSSATNSPNLQTTDLSYMFIDSNINSGLRGWDMSNVVTGDYMLANATGYDENLGSWTVTGIESLSGFMTGVTLSQSNYARTLEGWAGQAVNTGVYVDFGNSLRSEGATGAYHTLTGTYNWTIIDGGYQPTGVQFRATWDTSIVGATATGQLRLPTISAGSYNFLVDWGDGSSDTITVWNQSERTHQYTVTGIYEVTISGSITGFQFANGGDKNKLKNVSQWGSDLTLSTNSAFWGCQNMDSSATDSPTITTTNFASMFRDCYYLKSGLAGWNTSGVTSMNSCFYGSSGFNGDIGGWDMSSVADMSNMLRDANSFNNGGSSSINNWDTSSATNMSRLFESTALNQPIGSWDMGLVTNISYMLTNVDEFDQNISTWNVTGISNATNFMTNASGLSTTNYDALLTSWSIQNVLSSLTIDFGGSQYTASASGARDVLVSSKSWTISDSGCTDC